MAVHSEPHQLTVGEWCGDYNANSNGIPRVASGRKSRVGEIFFRGKDTEFQFCLKQSFLYVRTEKVTPSAGFTGKSGIF
jgi:hypothetical protein